MLNRNSEYFKDSRQSLSRKTKVGAGGQVLLCMFAFAWICLPAFSEGGSVWGGGRAFACLMKSH